MKLYKLISFVLIVTLYFSCEKRTSNSIKNEEGIWKQLGYGKIFKIENDSVRIYDICSVGCVEFDHVPLQTLGKLELISEDSLLLRKNIKTYKYIRQDRLPEMCLSKKKNPNDPKYNFATIWNTFNENYSFFDERNVNWKDLYDEYDQEITSEISEVELFQSLENMLNRLDDGHVEIEVPEHLEDTLQVLKSMNKGYEKIQRSKIGHFELADRIANKYCKNINQHNAGIVKWGMMKNNIAYIQINAMWLLAYYDIPQNLKLRDFYPLYVQEMDKRIYQRQDEIDGADKLMDTIIMEIKNSKAVVIDLRFNQGGKDESSLEFFGHFVNKKTKIASKKAKYGESFANEQSIYLEPRVPYYNKNIYILTSKMTASAAEVAVISTLALEKATRIGSSTEGVFSDGLDKKLPIGWNYVLSNEVYVYKDGNNYESIGIPPDIELNYSEHKALMLNTILAQIDSSGDTAIEKVFQIESSNN